jgi:hypothetical protein
MWRQSTVFGFIAGTLISLSLQALTAMGLFTFDSKAPSSGAQVAPPVSPTTEVLAPNPPVEPGAVPFATFGEHLSIYPFVLLSAFFFLVSGVLFFALSNTSQRLNDELASLLSPSMSVHERDEIERAVLAKYRKRLRVTGFAGVVLALSGFASLLTRLG